MLERAFGDSPLKVADEATFVYFLHLEMVTKLFLLQFVIFRPGFVKLARNDFHRNTITAQIISLGFPRLAEK